MSGLVFSICIAFFEKDIIFLLAIILGLLTIYLFGRNSVLVIIILSQIAFTGEDLIKFRPIITGISLLILVYFFITEFGFDFKNYPKVPKLVLNFIGFTIITLLVSSFFSIDILISLLSLLRLLVFFIFCYLLYSQIKDFKSIIYLIVPLFLALIIIGVTMLYEFFQKGSSFFVNDGALLRLAGIYENPNYVGLLIAITLPITLSYLMIHRYSSSSNFVIIQITFLIQLSILILADSRASFLSVAVSSIVIFLYSPNKAKMVLGTIVIISFLAILFLTDTSFLIDLFLRPERIGTRDLFWQSGIEVIKNNFLVGTGAGTFEHLFYTNASSSIIDLMQSSSSTGGTPHPHNLFLYFWAENGILGLLNICFFFYTFFYLIIKVKNRLLDTKGDAYPIVISILSIIVGILVRSFFEITGVITYGFITRDLPLWIILIILIFLYQNLEKHNIFVAHKLESN